MIGAATLEAFKDQQTRLKSLRDNGFNPEVVCVHAYQPLLKFIHRPWTVPVRLNLPWHLASSDLQFLHTRRFGPHPTFVDNDGAFLWMDAKLDRGLCDEFQGSIQGVHLSPAEGKFERHYIQYYHIPTQKPDAQLANLWHDIRLDVMNTLNGIRPSQWPSLWEGFPEQLTTKNISADGWFDVVFQLALRRFTGCPVQLSYLFPLDERLERVSDWNSSERPFLWNDPNPFPGWEFRIQNFATASIGAIGWLIANWPNDDLATKAQATRQSSDSAKEASPGQIVAAIDRHVRRLVHHTQKVKDLVLASTDEDQPTLEQVNSNAAMSGLLSCELNKAINDYDAEFWEALPSWRETRDEFWKVIGESRRLMAILATVGHGQFPTTFMLNALKVGTFWCKPRNWNEPAALIGRPVGFFAPDAGRDPFVLDDEEVRWVPCFDDVSLAVLREKLGSKVTVPVETSAMEVATESKPKAEITPATQPTIEERALAVLLANHGMSIAKIAERVPCDRSTLYRLNRFMAAYNANREAKILTPRSGFRTKGKDGSNDIEACADEQEVDFD